jgi:hypothetical protein
MTTFLLTFFVGGMTKEEAFKGARLNECYKHVARYSYHDTPRRSSGSNPRY